MSRLMSSLFLLILFVVPVTTHAQSVVMEVSGVASDDVLNVRSGPGASFEDIGDLQPAARVAVNGFDPSGRWAQIDFLGQTAYVAARFLTDVVAAPPRAAGLGPNFVRNVPADDPDGGLILRGGAGTTFPALGVLPNGTAVHVIELVEQGQWAMILHGTGVAWVGSAYLSADAPQADVAAGFPLNARCRGTEPFWSFEIAPDGTVVYTDMTDGPGPLTPLSQATGASPFAFTAGPYSGTITSEVCTDGMSDTIYTMRVQMTVPNQSGGPDLRSGCCNIAPAGGAGQ